VTTAAAALACAALVLVSGPVSRRPEPAGQAISGPALAARIAADPPAAGLAVAAALVAAGVAVGSPLLAGPAAVAAALAGRIAAPVLGRRRSRRRRADLTALVDALGRSVRSGATLPTALSDARRDRVAPALDPELATVAAEVNAGSTFAAAIDRWSRTAADPDLRLVAGTVAVLAATGGPAGPALDATARTLRARVASAEEVRALSAQANASAVVLVAAPAVVAVVLAAADPRLGTLLVHHPAGALCVSAALALNGAGLWWMQRIIDRGTR
jgi:tight adherence protein B